MISEMPTWASLIVFGLALALFALVIAFGVVPRLIRRQTPMSERPEEERSLTAQHVRRGLADFLARHRIIGDADIRNGEVLPVVPLERIHPLVVRLGNAYGVLRRLKNPAASSLYVRDSVNDRFRLLELDVEDIGEAVRLIQSLAKERGNGN